MCMNLIDEYLQKLNIAENAEFIIENFQNPDTEIAYAYLLLSLMHIGKKEEIKKMLDMELFKDSQSLLVKKTVADAIKKITKKPWE